MGRPRKRQKWSLDNFDDGYIDGTGRMRIYLPGHPRVDSRGYVLRSIVSYEAYHGITVTRKHHIHHENENRSDDSQDNLVKLTHSEHQKIHRSNNVIRICKECNCRFSIQKGKIVNGRGGTYCSHKCHNIAQRLKPWQWSRKYQNCIGCGTKKRKHCSKGLCSACYLRQRYREKLK